MELSFPVTIATFCLAIITISLLRFLYTYFSINKNESKIPLILPNQVMSIWKRILTRPAPYFIDQATYKFIKSNHSHSPKYVELMELRNRALFVVDLELIKHILIKDFEYFHDRRDSRVAHGHPIEHINLALVNLRGEEWKLSRQLQSKFYSSFKLKRMFETFTQVSKCMVKFMENSQNNTKELNMSDIFSRTCMEVMGLVAFGVNAGCFEGNHSKLYQIGIDTDKQYDSWLNRFKMIKSRILNTKIIRINFTDPNAIHYITASVKSEIKRRETLNLPDNEKPEDLLTFFLSARNQQNSVKNNVGVELTDDYIAAQSSMFYLGGFSNIEHTLSLTTYELALHPLIQTELFNEISKFIDEHGEIKYEAIDEMKFLNNVILESLRKHPSASAAKLERLCTQDYPIPGTLDIIKKGTPVIIPGYSILHDESYFPNPSSFNPGRFNNKIEGSDISSTSLPLMMFGLGPRQCIAKRYSLLKIKTILAHLILNFEVEPSERTPIPLKYANNVPFLKPADKIFLSLRHRNINPDTKNK